MSILRRWIAPLAALAIPCALMAEMGHDAAPLRLSDFRAEWTTAANREAKLAGERATMLRRLAVTIDAGAAQEWPGAFWTAGLINYRGPEVRAAIEQGLARFADLDPDFQRVVLQSVYTLYPGEYSMQVEAAIRHVAEPKPFAIAAAYLLDKDTSVEQRLELSRLLAERFPGWRNDGRLVMLWHRLDSSTPPPNPPVADLLSWDYRGRPVVFSLQRHDRRQPGRVVVRGAGGRFLRNPDGSLFTVPQLALSRTNMPGTITYGNSPQGLYVVSGKGVSDNVWIGPSPYLWSRVPFEAPVEEFLLDDSRKGTEWTPELYIGLLPPSWRDHWPIHEAYHAGAVGRSEMLMHGTTIDPDWYKDEVYHPFTPSAGCLCTDERWSPEDGSLVKSDQLDLVNAFFSAGDGTGYLVVVEIDGKASPVTAAEAEALVEAAE